MLTDEIKAVIQLIDIIASKLRGSEYAGRLAILRAQLLNLAREATQDSAKKAALSNAVPPILLTQRLLVERARPKAELHIMDRRPSR